MCHSTTRIPAGGRPNESGTLCESIEIWANEGNGLNDFDEIDRNALVAAARKAANAPASSVTR